MWRRSQFGCAILAPAVMPDLLLSGHLLLTCRRPDLNDAFYSSLRVTGSGLKTQLEPMKCESRLSDLYTLQGPQPPTRRLDRDWCDAVEEEAKAKKSFLQSRLALSATCLQCVLKSGPVRRGIWRYGLQQWQCLHSAQPWVAALLWRRKQADNRALSCCDLAG